MRPDIIGYAFIGISVFCIFVIAFVIYDTWRSSVATRKTNAEWAKRRTFLAEQNRLRAEALAKPIDYTQDTDHLDVTKLDVRAL